MASKEFVPTAVPLEDEVEEVGEAGGAPVRAAWDGSNVKPADINWLYKTRQILPDVSYLLPEGEIEPTPKPGEYVVFVAHFLHGFGLPASDFFNAFLTKYHLQPHHLPANAITLLSSYATFTDGYLGL
jgi:hypothetical protein